MRSISKDIFIAFQKCPKLAMYMSKHPELGEIAAVSRNNESENHFKEKVYGLICQLESEDGSKIYKDRVYKIEDGIEVSCDMVIKRKEETILVETVCSNELKDGPEFMWLVYKYYLLSLASIDIKSVYMIKIDPKYIEGTSPKEEIMYTIDVTKKLKQHLYKIPKSIRDFNIMECSDELPDVHKGVRCLEPHECPFKKHCWQDMPPTEGTVFEINGMDAYTKFVNYWNEIVKFEDVPKKKLDFRQEIQVRFGLKEKNRIKDDKIAGWLNRLHHENKVHFLYVGCINPAIPCVKGAKPFSSVPFQFSLDTKYPGSDNYNHFDFISDINDGLSIDKQFLNRLFEWISLNDQKGSIVVYDIERVKKCFKKLAAWNPDKKNRIDAFVIRFIDLREVFYNCWYYQPDFKGSYQLLEIAPKFLPDSTFLNIPINNSNEAGSMFLESYYKKSRHYNSHSELLMRYSRLNTYCLMEVVKFLQNLTNN